MTRAVALVTIFLGIDFAVGWRASHYRGGCYGPPGKESIFDYMKVPVMELIPFMLWGSAGASVLIAITLLATPERISPRPEVRRLLGVICLAQGVFLAIWVATHG